jgi:uncharacterized phage protein (TIGR01671 family)
MRATKFRGKFEGTWWYVRASNDHISSSWEQFWALVDRETVGEYIGDQDKSGKDIYEGDIIKVKETAWLVEPISSLERDERYHGLCVSPNGNGDNYFIDQGILAGKVIGNIYDNPDLLLIGAGEESYDPRP